MARRRASSQCVLCHVFCVGKAIVTEGLSQNKVGCLIEELGERK